MKLIKEFEQLEFFEKQILKIAIVKGVDDLKKGRVSILQIWILKGDTFNKSTNDFIMNIQ